MTARTRSIEPHIFQPACGALGMGMSPAGPLQHCFSRHSFVPSFLRLGSWNVVMFVSYEQLQRAMVLVRPALA